MGGLFKRSLLLRLGAAMATVTILAFVGMVSSVFIADTTRGEAGAVNQAGTLRMQSYRIASALVHEKGHDRAALLQQDMQLIDGFERRLNSPRLVAVLPREQNHVLTAAYTKVSSEWHDSIKPLLLTYTELMKSGAPANALQQQELLRSRYLNTVDGFVANIDHLVRLIEDDAESNIKELRLIQVTSLLLTTIVVFLTLYLVHTDVLNPLGDLLSGAERVRRGDLSVRVAHVTDDELGRLGRAFNMMAEDLSKSYAELRERVEEKTASLDRSNRSLELLYNTTRQLSESPFSENTYQALLTDISKLVGVGTGSICLTDGPDGRAYRLATTREVAEGVPDLCCPPKCELCLGEGDTHSVDLELEKGRKLNIMSIPIQDQERHYGVLLIEVPAHNQLEAWQMQLLQAVARQIGIAITMARRGREARRLALLEERGVIARELHDSLAQALSYLKIQVSRLDTTLGQPDGVEKARGIVDELRNGLNSAYRELRELLTTFRLKMDGRGLAATLAETIDEYRGRSGVDIEFVNQLQWGELTANEEIHVLQVVREALSNIARHAHAKTARIVLRKQDDGRVQVTVEDDGIGIPSDSARHNHYGLAIMEERARSLGGEIYHQRRSRGGTRVSLTFTPHRHANPAAEPQGVDSP